MVQITTATKRTSGRGRPRQFNLETVLERAVETFSGRGYHGTSMAELAAAMGITWGSLYKAFTDKHTLFLAAFDYYAKTRLELLRNQISFKLTGREKLYEVLMFYVEASHGITGKKGCLAVTVAAELATYDEDVAKRVRSAFLQTEQIVYETLLIGQEDGSISKSLDAKVAARYLLCYLKGMRIVGTLAPTRTELEEGVKLAMTSIPSIEKSF